MEVEIPYSVKRAIAQRARAACTHRVSYWTMKKELTDIMLLEHEWDETWKEVASHKRPDEQRIYRRMLRDRRKLLQGKLDAVRESIDALNLSEIHKEYGISRGAAFNTMYGRYE